MKHNHVARIVFYTALEIHKSVGPGLLESVYERMMYSALKLKGLHVCRQVPIDFEFAGETIRNAYYIDLLVENEVIVELKTVPEISELNLAQTRTYLKLTGIYLGLIINFNTILLKDGVRRVVHGQEPQYEKSKDQN